ncbi:MAG: molybdate ABC transporter permease subunit [Bacteriovoracaceae bacterium]|jgi:molybdate transport system permease protein|nr:molybdate ABC transporter permease subunit [Bacteriovoracaceae bacterium]
MSQADFNSLFLTLKLALVTTALLLVISLPLAYWISRSGSKLKILIEAFVSLPLILPPTVIGFYLLLALGPRGPIGSVSFYLWGKTLAFSFWGLVIGSICYSLPFVVQPIKNAFESIDSDLLDQASCLGASPLDRFFSVILPLSRPGILTGSVLGFAHTIGEFGVVLMIGGNIPGKTQVVSISIYEHVENLEYASAHLLSAILLVLCFALLVLVYGLNRKFSVVHHEH